jgi:hypothetical protein
VSCFRPNLALQSLQRSEGDEALHNSRSGESNKQSGFADVGLETQLLERNKRRLLRQPDWVGLAPTKPVDLPISSIKENDHMGKRRKTERSHIALTKRRRIENGYRDENQVQNLHVDDQKVRVKIGTDALTAHSTQLTGDVHSQASSDSMLFDQEGEDTMQPKDHLLTYSPPPGYTNASPEADSLHSHFNNEPPRDYEVGHREITVSRSAGHGPVELNAVEQGMAENGAASQGVRIVHTVEGIARPLDLVFATSNHSTRSRSQARSTGQELRMVEHANAEVDDARAWLKHGSERSNTSDQPQSNKSSPGGVAADDGPWRAFLSIPDRSSSHSPAMHSAEISLPHAHSTDRRNRNDHKSWSQHATQGNRTPFSSSSVSAPLPYLRQTSARPQGNSFETESGPPEPMGVDERLWRAFVFGSDDDTSLVSQRNDSADDESRPLRSGRSVSAASDTVSYTLAPFYQAWTGATCASPRRADAPRSGFPAISSISPYGEWGQVGELDERQASAHGVFGGLSVTQASPQDSKALRNPGVSSSGGCSSTRTSRDDLHRRGYTWGDSLEQDKTRNRGGWLQGRFPYIHNVADGSDYGGIDVVNPDSLT